MNDFTCSIRMLQWRQTNICHLVNERSIAALFLMTSVAIFRAAHNNSLSRKLQESTHCKELRIPMTIKITISRSFQYNGMDRMVRSRLFQLIFWIIHSSVISTHPCLEIDCVHTLNCIVTLFRSGNDVVSRLKQPNKHDYHPMLLIGG